MLKKYLVYLVCLVLIFGFSMQISAQQTQTPAPTPTQVTPTKPTTKVVVKRSEKEGLKKKAEASSKRAEFFSRRAKLLEGKGKADLALHYKKLAELSTAMAKEFEALSQKITP